MMELPKACSTVGPQIYINYRTQRSAPSATTPIQPSRARKTNTTYEAGWLFQSKQENKQHVIASTLNAACNTYSNITAVGTILLIAVMNSGSGWQLGRFLLVKGLGLASGDTVSPPMTGLH